MTKFKVVKKFSPHDQNCKVSGYDVGDTILAKEAEHIGLYEWILKLEDGTELRNIPFMALQKIEL